MKMYKSGKDGMPAKGNVQDFSGCGQHIIKPSHADMPKANPQSYQMAMNNTFHGMPAYPNQYVFEGTTQEPLRVTSVFKNE